MPSWPRIPLFSAVQKNKACNPALLWCEFAAGIENYPCAQVHSYQYTLLKSRPELDTSDQAAAKAKQQACPSTASPFSQSAMCMECAAFEHVLPRTGGQGPVVLNCPQRSPTPALLCSCQRASKAARMACACSSSQTPQAAPRICRPQVDDGGQQPARRLRAMPVPCSLGAKRTQMRSGIMFRRMALISWPIFWIFTNSGRICGTQIRAAGAHAA